jgi:hypothetical protein
MRSIRVVRASGCMHGRCNSPSVQSRHPLTQWNLGAADEAGLNWKVNRQRQIIYRGSGFLAVIWFSSSPNYSPSLPSVSSTGDPQEDWERETSCGQERGCGVGEESLVLHKHSILSGNRPPVQTLFAFFEPLLGGTTQMQHSTHNPR